MEWMESISGHYRTVYRLAGNAAQPEAARLQCRFFATPQLQRQLAARVGTSESRVIVKQRSGK